MAGRKNGLGRGLDALFPEKKSAVKESVKKATVKTENKTVVPKRQQMIQRKKVTEAQSGIRKQQ